jgi:DNA-binding transcriptional ArsR family regulator
MLYKGSLQSYFVIMRVEQDTLHLETTDELRALAHPLRVRILVLLSKLSETPENDGVVTSTLLARELGESTGATSYHLRQLAKFGLIQEVPDYGNARDRGWRATARHVSVAPDAQASPEHRAAQAEVYRHIVELDDQITSTFVRAIDEHPVEWRDAWRISNAFLHVRPDEVREVHRRIQELLSEYERVDPASRPPDAERVYASFRIIPAHQPKGDTR